MKKDEVLNHLRQAKSAHIGWVQRAKFLIEGVSINENAIPVNQMECRFGKWFYGEGQKLQYIRNNPVECMVEIEDLHAQLHSVYFNIYKIYYLQDKKGFLGKLFGKKDRVTQEEKDLAREYYKDIARLSKNLLKEITMMERRIIVLSEEEIEEL